jgi:phosphatidylserine/phosphatidylglycerophosphate/cardiolipin synthase-like enzyme
MNRTTGLAVTGGRRISMMIAAPATILMLVVATCLTSVPAAAAPAKPASFPSGAVFNTPRAAGGSAAEQYVWHNYVTSMINGTPSGGQITISTYAWDHPESLAAIEAADARGVTVKLVLWEKRAYTPEIIRLKKALNDGKTRGSYLKECKGSCLGPLSGDVGVHHAKIFTFSEVLTPTGTVKYVSTFGSANLTLGNGAYSFNNSHIVRNDAKMYAALNSYIALMPADRDSRGSKVRTVYSGQYLLYLYPQKSNVPDLILDTLNRTGCRAPAGYGSRGRTVVRVAMFSWSYGRVGIAKRLARLHKAGCNVAVIVNNDVSMSRIDRHILKILIDAKVPMWDGYYVRNNQAQFYQHGKTLILDGSVWGKGHELTYAGSANWTRNALDTNAETVVRVKSAKEYLRWWSRCKLHSHRMTTLPPIGDARRAPITPVPGYELEEPMTR